MKNELIDKFIEKYEESGKEKYIYRRILVRPTKFKSLIGFIMSLVFFIILIRIFNVSFIYFLLLLGDLAILIYYASNLFTNKGIGLPRMIAIPKEEIENNDYDKKN